MARDGFTLAAGQMDIGSGETDLVGRLLPQAYLTK
jgi:hypothetical protein